MSLAHLTAAERAAALAAVEAVRTGPPAPPEPIPAEPAPSSSTPAEPDGPVVETADQQVDRLSAARTTNEDEDFSEFWAGVGGGKRLKNVCGRDLQLPRSMPLRFEMESKRLAGREDEGAAIYLFDMLLGDGTWSDLIKRGIDGEQLPVLLMWATVNMSPGSSMTLAEAREQYLRMAAEKAAGKEPTPPPGLTPGARSGGTGPSSRPNSRGTGSKKKKSKR